MVTAYLIFSRTYGRKSTVVLALRRYGPGTFLVYYQLWYFERVLRCFGGQIDVRETYLTGLKRTLFIFS